MKLVDTDEYMNMLEGLISEGHEVSLVIAGNSMSPFLIDKRDEIFFKSPWRDVKRGDIVFYKRLTGQYVCHRVYRVKDDGVYLVGDAQQEIEGPLPATCIFALVTKAKRKGKWQEPGKFWWEFFARVWIGLVPLRGVIRKLYSLTFGRRKR